MDNGRDVPEGDHIDMRGTKHSRDFGALALFGINLKRAARHFRFHFEKRHAKPNLAGSACGEKRVDDAFDLLRTHAAAVIRYRDG